ncbi:MAG: hypothetical protein AB1640_17945 [bacterium]
MDAPLFQLGVQLEAADPLFQRREDDLCRHDLQRVLHPLVNPVSDGRLLALLLRGNIEDEFIVLIGILVSLAQLYLPPEKPRPREFHESCLGCMLLEGALVRSEEELQVPPWILGTGSNVLLEGDRQLHQVIGCLDGSDVDPVVVKRASVIRTEWIHLTDDG